MIEKSEILNLPEGAFTATVLKFDESDRARLYKKTYIKRDGKNRAFNFRSWAQAF